MDVVYCDNNNNLDCITLISLLAENYEAPKLFSRERILFFINLVERERERIGYFHVVDLHALDLLWSILYCTNHHKLMLL